MIAVISSAPRFAEASQTVDVLVNPEMSTKTIVPSRRRWRASGLGEETHSRDKRHGAWLGRGVTPRLFGRCRADDTASRRHDQQR